MQMQAVVSGQVKNVRALAQPAVTAAHLLLSCSVINSSESIITIITILAGCVLCVVVGVIVWEAKHVQQK